MASFSIVNNIASVNAQANLSASSLGLNKSLQRLSSGLRINNSGDDAAGLAIANGHRSKVAILTQGVRNANDGLSDLQTKDGALNNISTLLDRLSTLATQAASSSDDNAVSALSAEYGKVIDEIDRQASVAGLGDDWDFSVFVSSEATASDGEISETGIKAVDSGTLGLATTSFADAAAAKDVLAEVSSAITSLGSVQNSVGILENRVQFAISLAQSQIVNTKAAESRIRDANIAEESANMTRFNILNQSGIAALAQANQSSAAVLSLLR
jgi:flagellin